MKSLKLAFLGLLVFAPAAFPVAFTLASSTANTWTYTLTYNPQDNYSIPGGIVPSTITVSGLTGVTGATGPTSTDYSPTGGSLDLTNLAWIPTFTANQVVWTHNGNYGTGNFGVDMHVFGFTITAAGATSGTATVATSGFALDEPGALPENNRDISTTVTGPTAASAVPEPSSILLSVLGLFGCAVARKRSRVS